ncbi:hypothetical protein QQX09_12210 [Demequina sp. SYSU T00192]|uniref:Uncharacterized protein n=1 Tax=Demequina litoralis TaxID=3051660 RepID=A0ABT8GBV6_9MICO|nr:hypothetical protein [Demequina sp. SYSU T00192]MDN4476621.1 hypothetical protein [Demequina sp. SYSU T00192]
MPTASQTLAALTRSGARSGPKRDRAVLRKYADGPLADRALTVPAPALLAEHFVVPWLAEAGVEAFRPERGSAFLTRPIGSTSEPTARDQIALAADLRAALAALPEAPLRSRRPALADDPYSDVRLFAANGRERHVREYLADVLRVVRRDAPLWRAPRPEKAPRCPAKAPGEHAATHRALYRALEIEISLQWLARYIEKHAEPGQRIRTSELWTQAQEDFDGMKARAALTGSAFTAPGRNRFLKVAALVFGPARKVNGYSTHTAPTHPASTLAGIDELLDRVRERTEPAHTRAANLADRREAAAERIAAKEAKFAKEQREAPRSMTFG